MGSIDVLTPLLPTIPTYTYLEYTHYPLVSLLVHPLYSSIPRKGW